MEMISAGTPMAMDGVGWAGTAMILSPIFATLFLVALLTAVATRRQKKRRKGGIAERG